MKKLLLVVLFCCSCYAQNVENIERELDDITVLYRQGKQKEALSAAQKLYDKTKKIFGSEHPDTLPALNSLAFLYEKQGEYSSAETLFVKCLKLSRKYFGNEHLDTLTTLNNLASLYKSQGKYEKAEPLLITSKQLREKKLGKEHPSTLESMNNLADLYKHQGKYKKAESLFILCLEHSKNSLGKEHASTLVFLNGLAGTYVLQKKYDKAEPHLLECLKLRRKVLGKNHPSTLISVNNLAILYKNQGKYEKAASIFTKNLEWSKKNLGEKHPSTIIFANSLAGICVHQKKYQEAEKHYLKCLNLYQHESDKKLIFMDNLAFVYCLQKKFKDAQDLTMKKLVLSNEYLRSLFVASDKSVQANFLADQKKINDLFISVNLELENKDSAYNILYFSLTRKAFLLSASVQNLNIENESSETQNIFYKLNETQKLFSHLLFNAPKNIDLTTLQKKLNELKTKIENLERLLGASSKKYDEKTQKIKIKDIQKKLKDDEVIIDFLVFNKVELKEMQYGNRALLASVIFKNKIEIVSFKSFAEIVNALEEYRESTSKKKPTDLKKMYNLIWKPLTKYLQNIKNITIVPDAELHMFPFASLYDENDKYLIEKINFEVCSSLRMIGIERDLSLKNQKVIIFANPEYGKQGQQVFVDLPGTKKENENIQQILARKKISYASYSQKNATKEYLIKIKNPRILHLATHGFYSHPPKEELVKIRNQNLTRGTSAVSFLNDSIEGIPQKNTFFVPLAYCGLAFTGANNNYKQGILLGTEVPALSLWNTELVILSACETGVGTIKTATSEGKIYKAEEVYSLRRAFEEAGARAVLSTMWPAHDDATQKFMTRFYELYLDKVPPQRALRAVQLEFLHGGKYSHPYYWANFVLVGTDKHFPEHTNSVNLNFTKDKVNWLFIFIVAIFIVMLVCSFRIYSLKSKEIRE